MLAIALSVLLTLTADKPQVAVDRIEINEFGLNDGLRKQVILWRWVSDSEHPGYRVAQWWIIENDLMVARNREGWVVCVKGCELFTRKLMRTRTIFDPEVVDRVLLDPERRVPFVPQGLDW